MSTRTLEQNRKYVREWIIKNPEKWKKIKKKSRDKHHLWYMYYYYKRGALQRGLVWQLTKEDIFKLLKNNCYYCGEKSTGIDRVNNKNGYYNKNVVSCCKVCNFMKRTMSKEEFIDHCKKIIRLCG